MTLWRFIQMKITAFALSTHRHKAAGAVSFGQEVDFIINRNADLLWTLYAEMTIPGIHTAPTSTGALDTGVDTEAYWTNAIGQFLIEKAQLEMGGTTIDKLTNHYLFMWEELSGKPGKRLGEMIGKFDTVALRQAQSRRSRILYTPLCFYFTANTGLALPIVSMQFHRVRIIITFSKLADCIVVPANNTNNTTALMFKRTDGNTNSAQQTATSTAIGNADLTCELLSTVVYLDHDERSKFASGQFEQLISQVQEYKVNVTKTGATYTETSTVFSENSRVSFGHVVSEYIFALMTPPGTNGGFVNTDQYNYGGFDDTVSEAVLDPFKKISVKFNGNDRFESRDARYFRLVQPWQHHTDIPRDFIYVVAFAVDPEDCQPTGGSNHSRIDYVELVHEIDARVYNGSGSLTRTLLIYARNWNLIRFKHGLSALKFGS